MFSTNLFFGKKNGKVRVNLLKKLKCDINLIPIMIKLWVKLRYSSLGYVY